MSFLAAAAWNCLYVGLDAWNGFYVGLDSWDCLYLLCPTFWYHLQSGRSVSGAPRDCLYDCLAPWNGPLEVEGGNWPYERGRAPPAER